MAFIFIINPIFNIKTIIVSEVQHKLVCSSKTNLF